MNKIKLTIQNGHRNATGGATGTSGRTSSGKKINEVDWIDSVYYEIKKKIDLNQKLSSRIELSYDDAKIKNGVNADYFIAIHGDGSTNPSYDGGFVDDAPDDPVGAESWAFARKVADYYFNPMGIRFAPEHRTANSTYYYAFSQTGTKTKQFIIECGSMTNVSDMDKMANISKAADSILGGIIAYLKEKEPIFKDYESIPPSNTTGDDKDKQIADLKQQLDTLQKETDIKIAKVQSDCQAKIQDMKKNIINYVEKI